MKKNLWIAGLLLGAFISKPAAAQSDLDTYLATHRFTFSLDSGFDAQTQDTLKAKLEDYRLVLQAEGGSHFLGFYTRLPMVWIRFLQKNFHTRHFFFESGYSMQVAARALLNTGDTSLFVVKNKSFWMDWRAYNLLLPDSARVLPWGIDFERNPQYIKALQYLLAPEDTSAAAATIQEIVKAIKSEPDTLKDCIEVKALTRKLQYSFRQYQLDWKQYLGPAAYHDFEMMLSNPGSCDDKLKNRNSHMASRFLAFVQAEPEAMYYGELGMAHTVLNHSGVFGNLVNAAPGFKGKVATVNLYCYQCTTPAEEVNNWPIRDIEKDILTHFIPLCKPGFTLFDLTGLEKYKAYGPFLIVAYGEH